MSLDDAHAYARRHALLALIVARGERIVLEAYPDDDARVAAHPLYSGTKSFWGPLAVCASEDGLLELDEPAARSIPAWRDDPVRRTITLRMLLSLRAGYGFGGLGNAVPTFERAIALPLAYAPGTTFAYGGIAAQVFGAVLAHKLAPRRLSPRAYLQERLLEPAGIAVADWRRLSDGTNPLPTGAKLTARDWLAYGRYIARTRTAFAQCFIGSAANPRYGLGWWLAPAKLPSDAFYASGAGGQALYVIPSHDLVAVHFGKSATYKHEAFLRRLLAD